MALSEFGKAFADARAKGKLKFDFNGKSYTTARKDDAPRRGVKMSSPADTAGFTAERDKPRATGTDYMSKSPRKNTNTYKS